MLKEIKIKSWEKMCCMLFITTNNYIYMQKYSKNFFLTQLYLKWRKISDK